MRGAWSKQFSCRGQQLSSESDSWFLKVDIKDCKANTANLLVYDGGGLYLHQAENLGNIY